MLILTNTGKAKLDSATEANPVIITKAQVSLLVSAGSPSVFEEDLNTYFCQNIFEPAVTWGSVGSNKVIMQCAIPNRFLRDNVNHRIGFFDADGVLIASGAFVASTGLVGHGYEGTSVYTESFVRANYKCVMSNIGNEESFLNTDEVLTQLTKDSGYKAVARYYGVVDPESEAVDQNSTFVTRTGPIYVDNDGQVAPKERLVTTFAEVADDAEFTAVKAFAKVHYIVTKYDVGNGRVNEVWKRQANNSYALISAILNTLLSKGEFFIRENHTLSGGIYTNTSKTFCAGGADGIFGEKPYVELYTGPV